MGHDPMVSVCGGMTGDLAWGRINGKDVEPSAKRYALLTLEKVERWRAMDEAENHNPAFPTVLSSYRTFVIPLISSQKEIVEQCG